MYYNVIMKLIISEAHFQKLMKDFDESIRFSEKLGKYKWVNDKSEMGAYTSMTKRDDQGTAKFTATTQELPKSHVLAHNLFTIKNFNVTGALKHNKKYTPKPKDLIPDDSIEDFKQHIGMYILKYLAHLKKDIDVILTPQSSSEFNTQITNIISDLYKKYYRKDVIVKPNAFIKTPENAKVDIEYGKEYMKSDIENLYQNAPEEKIERILQSSIQDVYDLVKTWQIEGKVEKYITAVYNLQNKQQDIIKGRFGEIPPCKQRKVKEIQQEIYLILNLLETNVGKEHLKDTKFYHYKKLSDEPKKFEIKSLPDGIRRSIYNLMSLSKEADECYTYDKAGETISGIAPFIEKLKRNNKTILIFDDNLSSGRTMDDAALHLIENGVDKNNIVVITLGVVPKSGYGKFSKYYRT